MSVAGDIENRPSKVHFMLADLGLSHFSASFEGEEAATTVGKGGSQAYSMTHPFQYAGYYFPGKQLVFSLSGSETILSTRKGFDGLMRLCQRHTALQGISAT
jgi:hypothetical protein